MDLNDFINGFAKQFDETDISDIRSETLFQNLEEWSSLTALSIIAFLKIEYNKTITAKEIRSCATVKDLFELISSK
ncbi:acyl carrier protein [Bacteroides oleiciplenus]|uniref:Acyl carrier protein n=1 Tax=Bacteroides oleiciplenus TaxID=626931 RepID=A0A3E5B6J6_9BACE|nr:acyl carrier protein [Bacteroides oleiciplenus]RGN33228.1 acyl carrier protein [Bacteroides oleiciplenus]